MEIFSDFCVKFFGISGIFLKILRKKEQKFTEKRGALSLKTGSRFGAKSKNKFWFGYKKHVSVDMQSGLINKVAITHANVIDSKGFKNVTPKQGAVYADK